MAKDKHVSETPATQFLKKHHIPFTEHPYEYVDHGGASEAAKQLGVELHQVAKTLIMEDEHARPLIVVMHGDCEVSTKNLARQIAVKKVNPCSIETAQRHSGYLVGGTSPFATRKRMPVWVEATLLEFPILYLNGGRRGYLIGVPASSLTGLLGAKPVTVGIDSRASSS